MTFHTGQTVERTKTAESVVCPCCEKGERFQITGIIADLSEYDGWVKCPHYRMHNPAHLRAVHDDGGADA